MEVNGYKIEPKAQLVQANLKAADLERAPLWGADLRNAKLRRAKMKNADLRDADLRDADLRHADLRGANLNNAKLTGADLSNANLQNANLGNVDFYAVKINGAKFTNNANLRNANLNNVDFYALKTNCAKFTNFELEDIMTYKAPRKKIIYGLAIDNFKEPIERDKFSHFRADGLPKKSFLTKALAELAIARLVTEIKGDEDFNSYQCGDHFHIGHTRYK